MDGLNCEIRIETDLKKRCIQAKRPRLRKRPNLRPDEHAITNLHRRCLLLTTFCRKLHSVRKRDLDAPRLGCKLDKVVHLRRVFLHAHDLGNLASACKHTFPHTKMLCKDQRLIRPTKPCVWEKTLHSRS